MTNISFIIFTYNEEKRISFVIRNFIKYGKVFIMDGRSTDRTKAIAESLGAHFFTRPPSDNPSVETKENFDFIKDIIDTDWVYWGYADNIAPKTLVEKMVEISNLEKYKYVLLPLYTYLWGNTDNYSLKSYAPFFFHKNYVDFTNNHIHGIGKFLGTKDQVLKLPSKEHLALKHFSTYNIHKFVHGYMKYSEREAQEKYAAGKKFSVVRLCIAMLAYLWIYGRFSYKNGKLGLLIVLNNMFYRVMTYTRLYELENGISLESIESKYSKQKENILRDFL